MISKPKSTGTPQKVLNAGNYNSNLLWSTSYYSDCNNVVLYVFKNVSSFLLQANADDLFTPEFQWRNVSQHTEPCLVSSTFVT